MSRIPENTAHPTAAMARPEGPGGPLTAEETGLLEAIFERMFPADEAGAGATAIGVVQYVQGALSGPYADLVPTYQLLLAKLDEAARAVCDRGFSELAAVQQDSLIDRLEHKQIPGLDNLGGRDPFDLLWQHLREGLFCDPMYGGNRDMLGWRLLGFPGAQYGYTEEEQQIDSVITRVPRSVADLRSTHEGP